MCMNKSWRRGRAACLVCEIYSRAKMWDQLVFVEDLASGTCVKLCRMSIHDGLLLHRCV